MLPRAFFCLTAAIALTTSFAVPYDGFDPKPHYNRPEWAVAPSDALTLPLSRPAVFEYLSQGNALPSYLAHENLRARYARTLPARPNSLPTTIYWDRAFWDPWDLLLIIGAPFLFFGTLVIEAFRLSKRHHSHGESFHLRYYACVP